MKQRILEPHFQELKYRDPQGGEHTFCDGNPMTGEIIFTRGVREMDRFFLPKDWPFTGRRKDRLVIMRWTGTEFRLTCQAA